jgi:heme exporter protein C
VGAGACPAGGGTWLSFAAPADYQQGDTVRIMFIHVPAATLGSGAYAALGVSVFRPGLPPPAGRRRARRCRVLTGLALITGSLWGQPMWGTWWVWDARLTSVLVLFLFYLGYMALRASIDDEAKAGRAAAVLGLVGLINLPIVKFSVDWWNTLHQPASLLRAGGTSLDPAYLAPLLTMMAAYGCCSGHLADVDPHRGAPSPRADAARPRRARSVRSRLMLDLDMSPYGVFVWSSWAISAVALAAISFAP